MQTITNNIDQLIITNTENIHLRQEPQHNNKILPIGLSLAMLALIVAIVCIVFMPKALVFSCQTLDNNSPAICQIYNEYWLLNDKVVSKNIATEKLLLIEHWDVYADKDSGDMEYTCQIKIKTPTDTISFSNIINSTTCSEFVPIQKFNQRLKHEPNSTLTYRSKSHLYSIIGMSFLLLALLILYRLFCLSFLLQMVVNKNQRNITLYHTKLLPIKETQQTISFSDIQGSTLKNKGNKTIICLQLKNGKVIDLDFDSDEMQTKQIITAMRTAIPMNNS